MVNEIVVVARKATDILQMKNMKEQDHKSNIQYGFSSENKKKD